MLLFYKLALAPVLLLQAARLRSTVARLAEPQGPRSGTVGASADTPLRLLFIGDSSAAGVGVEWQHEALSLQASTLVSQALDRPVRWELIAKSGLDTREVRKLVQARKPGPADVVVTALGVNDVTAQRVTKDFIADYQALARTVATLTGAHATIASGLPPLQILPAAPQPLRWYLGQCASRLDNALRRLCESHDNLRHISLGWARAHDMARDGFHPGKRQYRRWAELIAREVVTLVLRAPTSSSTDDAVARLTARAGDKNAAFMRADMKQWWSLAHIAPDFTLMQPFGGAASHGFDGSPERLARMASYFRNGKTELEIAQTCASKSHEVLVMRERQRAEI